MCGCTSAARIQFAPICEGDEEVKTNSCSGTAVHDAPHYGPRCLVRSRRAVAPRVLCREYMYLPGDPTATLINKGSSPLGDREEQAGNDAGVPAGERPQRPLRAAFQLETTAKLPWQGGGN